MNLDQARAPAKDPLWLVTWTIIVLGFAAVVFLLLITVMNPLAAFLWAFVFATTAGCVIFLVWMSPRPLRWRTAGLPAVMGLLAGLAPVSLVVFLRLTVQACIVVDTLGLAYVGPARGLLLWLSGMVWLASTAFFTAGVLRPAWRSAAVSMVVWSFICVIPTTILLFFSFYGDPGPDCASL